MLPSLCDESRNAVEQCDAPHQRRSIGAMWRWRLQVRVTEPFGKRAPRDGNDLYFGAIARHARPIFARIDGRRVAPGATRWNLRDAQKRKRIEILGQHLS